MRQRGEQSLALGLDDADLPPCQEKQKYRQPKLTQVGDPTCQGLKTPSHRHHSHAVGCSAHIRRPFSRHAWEEGVRGGSEDASLGRVASLPMAPRNC